MQQVQQVQAFKVLLVELEGQAQRELLVPRVQLVLQGLPEQQLPVAKSLLSQEQQPSPPLLLGLP